MISAIQVTNLSKAFNKKKILHDLSLDIPQGEMVALIGPSGSGKSTLLRHLSGLTPGDKSDSSVLALGRPVQTRGVVNQQIRRLRADIGYVFQQFNLVGRLTVLQNVLLGCLGRMSRWRGSFGLFNTEEKERAFTALKRVGLLEHAYSSRASTLSGGQQQRVAIARTLCQQAEVILADEPIASLDPESARNVMEILADINKKDGKTVIVTLHQVDYAMRYCRHAIALKAGRKYFDGPIENLNNQILNNLYGSENTESVLFSDAEQVKKEDNLSSLGFVAA